MPVDKPDDDLKRLETGGHPTSDELASAPTLEDWSVVMRGTEPAVSGVVQGSRQFTDGQKIVTSVLAAVDRDRKWVRTRNTLYKLGRAASDAADPYASWPKLLRMALADSWLDAYKIARDATEDVFFDANIKIALAAADSRADSARWLLRRECCRRVAKLIDESGIRTGRAVCWSLLAVDPTDLHAVKRTYTDLLNIFLTVETGAQKDAAAEEIIYGWSLMAQGHTVGGDPDDPIMRAARLGAVHGVRNALTPNFRIDRDNDDDDDAGDPAADRPGAVVLATVGGIDTGHGKEARKAFEPIVGRKLPFVAPPADLAKAHRTLDAEFPHLSAAIRVLIGDLQVAGNCSKIRPTLFVGPAGGGKSRLVRRLAEVTGLRINRYDAASASDSSFGGTARRWSSGEPCFPLTAILANKVPNGIILLDELDKSGTGITNGSLTNSLLPMIEIETSCRFSDPYTQSECDLSFLSFIATCNDDRALPGPLRDRFRVLKIPAPGLDHLPTLARGVVADIAAEQSGDPRFFEPLNDGELAIAEGLWRDGSVRRLRSVIERLLARRESHPRN